ncbi:class I SAM-dependent methyltransferase [Fundidesulfovibrio soli]|uniref:class I SAM-dependent methyltransferase n=1 Tax=Fundidesulfovibrio soli TaxID=2922716 RepID=UPI001FAF0CCC|nr:methyltransferase domain-containing protein [Fundidesulfovibrio soli]
MTEHWHDIASLDHFWIRRRFEVLTRLVPGFDQARLPVADIGCGRGLLQRQLETAFGLSVDGFDLDEQALSRNISTASRVFLYNIHDRSEKLYKAYGTIFLFDVLEHIEDQQHFLQSALHHLRPGGQMLVNLPAYNHLFSTYDTMAGHLRRYTLPQAVSVLQAAGLKLRKVTYWGAPYYPLLLVRKVILSRKQSEKDVIEKGFEVNTDTLNKLLGLFGRLEPLPQKLFGTSVMAVCEKMA